MGARNGIWFARPVNRGRRADKLQKQAQPQKADLGDLNMLALERTALGVCDLAQLTNPWAPGATITACRLGSMTCASSHLDAHSAWTGCIGEAAELMAQCRIPPEVLRNSGHGADIPADVRALSDGLGVSASRVVSGFDLRSGAQCQLPEGLFFQPQSVREAPLVMSSGCAAGKSTQAALCGALCEIIEHEMTQNWWLGGGDNVSPLRIEHLPSIARMIGQFRENAEARRTYIAHLATYCGIAVCAAWSVNAEENSAFCIASAASNQGVETAAFDAMRELAQMEWGLWNSAPSGGTTQTANVAAIDRRLAMPAAKTLSAADQNGEDLHDVIANLHQAGRNAYACLLHSEPGLYVIKVISPPFVLRRTVFA